MPAPCRARRWRCRRPTWRRRAGFDGTGIRIGALSDSLRRLPGEHCCTDAAADVASGDLPAAGVTVLDESPWTATDEGRAMLQLVHDIAPGAQLGFASAFNGEVQFANNILALRSNFKADVIVDDVIYLDEPMFSDGIVAQAVDAVSRSGGAYFSSAGNEGLEAYQAVYPPDPFEAAQRSSAQGANNLKLDQIPAEMRPKTLHLSTVMATTTTTVAAAESPPSRTVSRRRHEHDLVPVGRAVLPRQGEDGLQHLRVRRRGNWMDPASPSFPGFYTTDDNTQTDQPFEFVILPPFPGDIHGGANVSDYQIVIGKVNDGPARNIKYVNINGLGVSQRQGAPARSSVTPRRAVGQAVAAIYYAIPNFPEDFSSPGPVTIYWTRTVTD